jgi:diacylglycerol kinase
VRADTTPPATAPRPPRSFAAAVACAVIGVRLAARRQANLRAHLAIAGIVLIAGAVAGLSGVELAVTAAAIGLVLAAELFNTSIELLTDLVCPDEDPRAGAVKDVAAAAVLTASAAAVAAAAFIAAAHLWPQGSAAERLAAAFGAACLAGFALAVRGRPARG